MKIFLVFWYVGEQANYLVYEEYSKADEFMRSHPYRAYHFAEVTVNPEDVTYIPQRMFPK